MLILFTIKDKSIVSREVLRTLVLFELVVIRFRGGCAGMGHMAEEGLVLGAGSH